MTESNTDDCAPTEMAASS